MMRTFSIAASAAALIAALTPSGHAQTPPDPHELAVALSADAGPYPDVFTVRCGVAPNSAEDGAAVGVGAGVSAIDRPRSMVFVEADLRASFYRGTACGAISVGPTRDTFYQPAAATPAVPLVRTLVHVGLETPASSPLILRATAGGGLIWGAHPAPIGSITIGASGNNPGARFFAELVQNVSRVRMNVTEEEYLPTGPTTSVLDTEVTHPAWKALRFGVEWPLR
jgi:hypothetical protein